MSPQAVPVVGALGRRCRCGHLPTHHIAVRSIEAGASYALKSDGPCELCGEAICRQFTPGGPLR